MLSSCTVVKGSHGWDTLGKLADSDRIVQTKETVKYTFVHAHGRGGDSFEIVVKLPHLFKLHNGQSTWDLRHGDVVAANSSDSGFDNHAWLHGFLHRQKHHREWLEVSDDPEIWQYKTRLRELAVVEDKVKARLKFKEFPYELMPYELPDTKLTAQYIGSWIRGFMDGSFGRSQVGTTDKATAEWVSLHAPFAGYVHSGKITEIRKASEAKRATTASTTFHTQYNFQMVRGSLHPGFRLKDIVLCHNPQLVVYYPETKNLCLSGGLAAFA
jgi:hypothetical protein